MSKFFSHETSTIDDSKCIGDGTKIWHYSHIMKDSLIGKNCIIGQNVFIANGVKIGNNVKIQNNVSVYSGVELEDDVFIGPSVVFTNVINPRSFVERKKEFKTTIIKKGATVGANSTIICGLKINNYALIGAGAVVTKNVNNYEVVAGNPAKRIGWISKFGSKLLFDNNNIAKCETSSQNYKLIKDKVHIYE